MTALLERAISKTRLLPEPTQNFIAALILEELADEMRWDDAFANSQDILAKLSEAALVEYHAGKTELLDPNTHYNIPCPTQYYL